LRFFQWKFLYLSKSLESSQNLAISKIVFLKSFSASGGQICPGGATILPLGVLYYIRYCKKEFFSMPKDIHTQDSSQQRASRLLLAMGVIVLVGALAYFVLTLVVNLVRRFFGG
jgi:hypothetical protein